MAEITPFARPPGDDTANDKGPRLQVLIADDESETAQFIAQMVQRMGHDSVTVGNGRDALDILQRRGLSIDVIFLDRIMPFMDGRGVLAFIAQDPALRRIPVIMPSGPDDEKDDGVFYVLHKPYDALILQSVLAAALRHAAMARRLARKLSAAQTGFDLLSSAKFKFRTLAEAESLAGFIARCFPAPDVVVTGLSELMINAIEHGNLGIGAEEKESLLGAGRWLAEVEKRLADPAYRDRYAEIAVTRRDGGIYAVITDQGAGFAWENYIRIDPARAEKPCGRGIAHAATICFDMLRYDHIGNKAVAFVRGDRPLDW